MFCLLIKECWRCGFILGEREIPPGPVARLEDGQRRYFAYGAQPEQGVSAQLQVIRQLLYRLLTETPLNRYNLYIKKKNNNTYFFYF